MKIRFTRYTVNASSYDALEEIAKYNRFCLMQAQRAKAPMAHLAVSALLFMDHDGTLKAHMITAPIPDRTLFRTGNFLNAMATCHALEGTARIYFDKEFIRMTKDGTKVVGAGHWSGHEIFDACTHVFQQTHAASRQSPPR